MVVGIDNGYHYDNVNKKFPKIIELKMASKLTLIQIEKKLA